MSKQLEMIEDQLDMLRKEGRRKGRWSSVSVSQKSDLHPAVVHLHDYKLPDGYDRRTVDLFFVLPFGYPGCCPPNSFWTSEVRQKSGGSCRGTNFWASGKSRQQKPDGAEIWWMHWLQAWNPNCDNLVVYEKTIWLRFQETLRCG